MEVHTRPAQRVYFYRTFVRGSSLLGTRAEAFKRPGRLSSLARPTGEDRAVARRNLGVWARIAFWGGMRILYRVPTLKRRHTAQRLLPYPHVNLCSKGLVITAVKRVALV